MITTEQTTLSYYIGKAQQDAQRLSLSEERLDAVLNEAFTNTPVMQAPATPTYKRIGGYMVQHKLVTTAVVSACVVAGFVYLMLTRLPMSPETVPEIATTLQTPTETLSHASSSEQDGITIVSKSNALQHSEKQAKSLQSPTVKGIRLIELNEEELRHIGVELRETEPTFRQPTQISEQKLAPFKRYVSFPMLLRGTLRRTNVRWWQMNGAKDSLAVNAHASTETALSLTWSDVLDDEPNAGTIQTPLALSQPDGGYYPLVQHSLDAPNSASTSENMLIIPINELLPVLVRPDAARELVLWYRATPEFLAMLPERYREEWQRHGLQKSIIMNAPKPARQDVLSVQSVAPNPVRDQATLRFTLLESRNVTLSLHDIYGKRIATLAQSVSLANGEQELPFICSNNAAGVYVLVLTTDKGEQAVWRIIIER